MSIMIMTLKYVVLFSVVSMVSSNKFENITLDKYRWLNEPPKWDTWDDTLEVTTGNFTDFWQETYYNFSHNSGHMYGIELKDDFTFSVCIEADFSTLYDQAGLMIYAHDKHWLKAGIEYNDGQPMIGSVNTHDVSDWATGIYSGNPRKFYLRLTKVNHVIVVKYSTDNKKWTLLRLAPFPRPRVYFVGLMACSPQREGLGVRFSDIKITEPVNDVLHSN